MKIAITTSGNEVFQHFGQSKLFTIYQLENNGIESKTLLDSSDSGHSALAVLLKEQGVNTLICGGIGQGAIDALASNGVEVIPGVSGSIDDAINKYLAGEPLGNPGFRCNHHGDHGHGHGNEEGHECHCGKH